MKNYSYLHKKYLVPTYPFRGKTFIKGAGVYLYDADGGRYLDLMTNYGVNIFGYHHPQITQALKSQLDQLTNLHGSFAQPVRIKASQQLIQACGGQLKQVYWANSGTEAIEAAIKFAFIASGKSHFVAAQGGYHGKTLGALSLTFNKKYRLPFKSLLPKTSFVAYGEVDQLEAVINQNTAAIVLEPIQGETGVILPPKNYLRQVADLCRQKGVILILDEIQTGLGRTGSFLASHPAKIEPDIVCLAKGLGGGIPIGATLVSSKIAAKLPRGSHTSTFGGNPLACAGVLATLKLLTSQRLSRNAQIGRYFLDQLRSLKSHRIKAVRGKGLMLAIELTGKCTPVLKALQDRFILAAPSGDNIVRLLPPYIITKTQIDQAVVVLEEILNHV